MYGENGSGKTTLALILRSLKNNPPLLTKIRSFDRTVPQTIEVLTDIATNPKITFSNNVWDSSYPNLEIFDIHFINENIYTGLEIQNTHKKNLFEIIFGQQGVQLKTEIQTIKDNIQNGNNQIRDTKSKIELAIDNAFSAVDFCNLPADPDIDRKISAKEGEIITAKSFQEILSKNLLTALPNFQLPFNVERAISALSQSIDNISEEYLQKVNTHKGHLGMNGKEEEWIKQGYESITDETCPFCLRKFDESTDIIEAYKQYFNLEYNALLRELKFLDTSIDAFNVEATILQIETVISSNLNLIEFWSKHITNAPTLTSILDYKATIQAAFDPVKTLFKEKSSDPIHALPTEKIITLKNIVETFDSLINASNTEIETFNARITTLKTSSQPNILQLESDLKKLKAIKKKELTTVTTLCGQLSTFITSVDTLNAQKESKQQQLDTYSLGIFTNYTAKINQYLQAFAPYLEIRNLNSGYVGSSKEPMIKYALHVNGNEIKFEDSAVQPSFKYSLSEGDKSALALSFFLTKLELDGNLQDQIVVFDDPVSSFDLNRKSTTISKLIDIGQKAKQLFVLSHNIIFAGDFWKSVNQVPVKSQCSKIEFIGNSSVIVEFNIDTETLSSILKDSLMIKKYLDNGCFTDQERRNVARCLRPALESYFHLKYFDLVAPSDWLGDFIAMVREATPDDRFYRLQSNINELTDINDYSKKYHHRFNTNNESEPITDAELRNYCDRTLKLIQVI